MHGLSDRRTPNSEAGGCCTKRREQLLLGNYDLAQAKVDEAEALDVKWGLFDDTPAKVGREIKKLRPRSSAQSAALAAWTEPHDRRTARAKLREARAMLNNRQFEQAEAIALEVKNWGLTYGVLRGQSRQGGRRGPGLAPPRQDPQHAAARAVEPGSLRHPGAGIAPADFKAGKLDEAETKARMAQRMNVVPPLTADRAETVLHEIAMARPAEAAPAVAAVAAPRDARART